MIQSFLGVARNSVQSLVGGASNNKGLPTWAVVIIAICAMLMTMWDGSTGLLLDRSLIMKVCTYGFVCSNYLVCIPQLVVTAYSARILILHLYH